MSEELDTQELLKSLKQFVNDNAKDDSSKSKKIILKLAPAIKDAAKKGISKKQVFDHLKSKGFKMSYSSFREWLDKLNIYSSKPKNPREVKKVSEQGANQNS